MCVVKIAPFQYGVECVYPLALVKARNSIVVIHRVSLFSPQIPWNTIKINASSCELWGANERIVLFKDGRFILILASSLPDSIWCDNKNHHKEINQLIICWNKGRALHPRWLIILMTHGRVKTNYTGSSFQETFTTHEVKFIKLFLT